METLKVKISATEKKRLKISRNEIDFEELERKIQIASRQAQLERTAKAAKKAGLSKMTNTQINQIIKEARKGA